MRQRTNALALAIPGVPRRHFAGSALSAAAQPAAVPGLHWGVWAGLGLIFVALDFFEKRAAARWVLLAAVDGSTGLGWRCCWRPCALVRRATRHYACFAARTIWLITTRTQWSCAGESDAPPDVRDNAVMLRVRVDALKPFGQHSAAAGERLCAGAAATWTRLAYGDTLSLYGNWLLPSENEEFSYAYYLAVRGIHSIMYYPSARLVEHGGGNCAAFRIYALRGKAYETIERLFPQPEAGLLSGILLGLGERLPADLENAFRDTGTTHIIAISGFNIASLAGLFFGLAARLVAAHLCAADRHPGDHCLHPAGLERGIGGTRGHLWAAWRCLGGRSGASLLAQTAGIQRCVDVPV